MKLKSIKARAWNEAANLIKEFSWQTILDEQVSLHMQRYVAPALRRRAAIIERNQKGTR